MDQYQTVIIGGCAAGFSAAASVAASAAVSAADRAPAGASTKARSPVLLIDGEGRLPYKRTKVSKSFAAGWGPDAFALEDPTWYREKKVSLLTGQRVRSIDPDRRSLLLEHGRQIDWETLILATGTRPRRPSFTPEILDRLHFPVTAARAERLRAQAVRARTALVVGMGVLGVEAVDQLRRMGKEVTLLGNRSVIMHEELNTVAWRHMDRILTDAGVRLLFDEEVADIELSGNRYRVTFARSGVTQSYDLVVYGIGVEPEVSLAEEAGLAVKDGIVVDEFLRTSHPSILAAGDVAQHPDGRVTHLWRHAEHQGRVAGANAVGASQLYEFVPFRLKCNILDHYFFSVGRPSLGELEDHEVVEHTHGSRYLCAYYRDGVLTGLIMLNDEERQKSYLQAVIESWPRTRFEREFL